MPKLFQQFLQKPLETGSITPSSPELAKLITNLANLSNKKCVVELGSGTGVFTKNILQKISPDCVFFSLEINKSLVKETNKNFPNAIVYHASAQKIKKYLAKHKRTTCDCVISGLPWASFEYKTQKKILDTIYDALEDGGEFITFAYIHGILLPAGIKFKKMLKEKFKYVQKSKIVWKNIPPAFIYHCKK